MKVPPATINQPCGAQGRPTFRGVLVAGVGNVLRGDDGVGVRALQLLQSRMGVRANLHFYESGIAGVGLVQQLMDGYDALIILDAVDRKAEPGTIFVIEPTVEQGACSATIDLHLADPSGALRMADALGVRPKRVWIIGCQIEECDELGAELSPAVSKALPEVVRRAGTLVDALLPQTRRIMSTTDNSKHAQPLAGLTAVDEILQILYWLRGEGLGTDVSARNLVRFLPMSEEAIEPVLSRMAEARLVIRVASSADAAARYRLTDQGVSEGGRRFADEFADIARPGHGECGDPSCDCHQTGDPADCHHHHGALP